MVAESVFVALCRDRVVLGRREDDSRERLCDLACLVWGVVRCDKQPGVLEPVLRTSRETVRQ